MVEGVPGLRPRTGAGTYTSREICDLAGISYRMLDYWLRIGLLEATVSARGSGSRRLFMEDDLPIVRLCSSLMRMRHDSLWVAPIMESVLSMAPPAGWRGHWLVIHSDGEVEVDGDVRDVAIVVRLDAFVTEPLAA